MKRSSEELIGAVEGWFQAMEDGEFCWYSSGHKSTLSGDFSNA